jgi:hypothetical protein
MAADLSQLDQPVIQIDGLHVTKELVLLAAISIDGQGRRLARLRAAKGDLSP